jgi:peptidoglycan/LPS O-acetylase OafA/YrhL
MTDSRVDAKRARAIGRRIARRTDRLSYFDGLRCLAVLSVVLFHGLYQPTVAVSIFFVISGLSVYLWHSAVYAQVPRWCSLALAAVSHRVLERPAMRLGRRLVAAPVPRPAPTGQA